MHSRTHSHIHTFKHYTYCTPPFGTYSAKRLHYRASFIYGQAALRYGEKAFDFFSLHGTVIVNLDTYGPHLVYGRDEMKASWQRGIHSFVLARSHRHGHGMVDG